MKRFLTRSIIAVISALIVFSAVINLMVTMKTAPSVHTSPDQLPRTDAVLVLGAAVYPGGIFSPILHDRMSTALDLYRSGKVKKFLLSGDHRSKYYNEVNAMKKYLMARDIPPEDIFLDHAGFETYDSIYRARDVFRVNNVTICTQRFHLYRALYIASKLGVDAYGITADRRTYQSSVKNNLREYTARVKAWIKILLGSEPEYLGAPLPISGDGRTSWDIDSEIPKNNTSLQDRPADEGLHQGSSVLQEPVPVKYRQEQSAR